jgi:hypothetical protein
MTGYQNCSVQFSSLLKTKLALGDKVSLGLTFISFASHVCIFKITLVTKMHCGKKTESSMCFKVPKQAHKQPNVT